MAEDRLSFSRFQESPMLSEDVQQVMGTLGFDHVTIPVVRRPRKVIGQVDFYVREQGSIYHVVTDRDYRTGSNVACFLKMMPEHFDSWHKICYFRLNHYGRIASWRESFSEAGKGTTGGFAAGAIHGAVVGDSVHDSVTKAVIIGLFSGLMFGGVAHNCWRQFNKFWAEHPPTSVGTIDDPYLPVLDAADEASRQGNTKSLFAAQHLETLLY